MGHGTIPARLDTVGIELYGLVELLQRGGVFAILPQHNAEVQACAGITWLFFDHLAVQGETFLMAIKVFQHVGEITLEDRTGRIKVQGPPLTSFSGMPLLLRAKGRSQVTPSMRIVRHCKDKPPVSRNGIVQSA